MAERDAPGGKEQRGLPERRLLRYSHATYIRALAGDPRFLNPDVPLTPDVLTHLEDRPVAIDTAAHHIWQGARASQHETRMANGTLIKRSDGTSVAYRDATHQEQVRWWGEQVATHITTQLAGGENAGLLLEGLRALGYTPTTQEALGSLHQEELTNFFGGTFYREKAGNDRDRSVGRVREDLSKRFLQVRRHKDATAAIDRYEAVVNALQPLFNYIYDERTRQLLEVSLGCPAARITISPKTASLDVPEAERPVLRELHNVVVTAIRNSGEHAAVPSSKPAAKGKGVQEGGGEAQVVVATDNRRRASARQRVVASQSPPVPGLGSTVVPPPGQREPIVAATILPDSAIQPQTNGRVAPAWEVPSQRLLTGAPKQLLLAAPSDDGMLLPPIPPHIPPPILPFSRDFLGRGRLMQEYLQGSPFGVDNLRRRSPSPSPSDTPLLVAPSAPNILQLPGVSALPRRAPETHILEETLELQQYEILHHEMPEIETQYEYIEYAGAFLGILGEIDSLKMQHDALWGMLDREDRDPQQATLAQGIAELQQRLLLILPQDFLTTASAEEVTFVGRLGEGKINYGERVAFAKQLFGRIMHLEDIELAAGDPILDRAHASFEDGLPDLFASYLAEQRPLPSRSPRETEAIYEALLKTDQFGYVPRLQQLYYLVAQTAGKTSADMSSPRAGWRRLQYMQRAPLLYALDKEFDLGILAHAKEQRLRAVQSKLEKLEGQWMAQQGVNLPPPPEEIDLAAS